MPLEKGGRADKKGNQYEINCIIYEILKNSYHFFISLYKFP